MRHFAGVDLDSIPDEGTIVDATISGASGSTKYQEKQRDPEMKATRKSNQWYIGTKPHLVGNKRVEDNQA